ncbi:hypothetical protein PR048_019896 [Dryococelus australis]|uniref:Uncharacterized protein n=1 Tax=Dryococelus australis TaxID=614101 RepID=A0ABQ9H4Q9_9NEOP|nr:hypothetical protein PR048_019896 [Dryococelus australis]
MVSTTGESLAKTILDILRRLQLHLSNLRGQTCDGAANMSGQSFSVNSTALECVNDLGVLVSQSGKLKAGLCKLSINNDGPAPNQIKPLCPTRKHCRVGPVRYTLEHYRAVHPLAAAETVKFAFKHLRREQKFDDIFERCYSYVEELDLEPVKTPRIRKPPQKYSSEANYHVETDFRKYFRNQFYEALEQCKQRFGFSNQAWSNTRILKQL